VIGQTFVVGRTGALTAIEAALWGPCPATDGMILTVYRGSEAIATSRLSCTALGSARLYGLSATTRGPVTFDLSTSCANVAAGETLTFLIAPDAPAPPAGICPTGGFGMCSSGPRAGNPCFSDNDCSGWSIGVSESSANPYAGGDMHYGGAVQTGYDMVFKAYVR
jgi:hypothetical protein